MANGVSLPGYFRRSGILNNNEDVAKNEIFETVGSKISNETPLGVCLRPHYLRKYQNTNFNLT